MVLGSLALGATAWLAVEHPVPGVVGTVIVAPLLLVSAIILSKKVKRRRAITCELEKYAKLGVPRALSPLRFGF